MLNWINIYKRQLTDLIKLNQVAQKDSLKQDRIANLNNHLKAGAQILLLHLHLISGKINTAFSSWQTFNRPHKHLITEKTRTSIRDSL